MLRRHVLLALAALAPAGALAQTAGQVTFTPDAFIGAAECSTGGTVTLRWTLDTAVTGGGTIRIFASNRAPDTNGLCRDSNATEGIVTAQVGADQTAQGQAGTLDVSTVEVASKAGFGACNATATETITVCAHHLASGSSSTVSAKASGSMRLQLVAPNAPTLTGVSPGDGRLFASWTEATTGQDATRFILVATPSGGTAVRSGEIVGTSGSVGNLANGTTYAVQVIGLSEGGNESPLSNALTATPAPTQGFWDTYQDQGGVEEGGCQTGAAGALALLGLAALALGRRRS
jgi:MYXO-CTERM domain-containing protein